MKNTKTIPFLIGGIFASIVASACCVGPIVFAVLGLTSAGLIFQLEPFRGIFSLITIALLVVAFYLTYRKKPTQECVSDSYCAEPRADKVKKRILWTVTALVMGLLTFPYWSSVNKSTFRNKSSSNVNAVVKEYYIKGMTCAGCIVGVQNALKKATNLPLEGEDVSVGKMLLRFSKNDYAAFKTDCMVSTAVESATEYKVYLDKGHVARACK